MVWKCLHMMLGIFVVMVVLNLLIGFICFAPIGQIGLGLAAAVLMVPLNNKIRRESMYKESVYMRR